jgi:RimJ/RimL family protein N-acetyltransferase
VHLTTLDYARRFALVAADPVAGRGVAIGRYEPLSEGVAEVAVVVDPAWRRVGLATLIVELLAQAALAHGIHTFSASYMAENRPVAALLDAAHAGRAEIRRGIGEAAVGLDGEQVAIALRDQLAGAGDPPGPAQPEDRPGAARG